MKELALVLIVIQLSFINAKPKLVNDVSGFRQDAYPIGNAVVEIDILNDNYLTQPNHVIKKRQADPAGGPEQSSRRRRRRRRKKVPSGGSNGERRNDGPSFKSSVDGPPFKSSIDGPINPPEENFLLPRKRTSRRRRPTPSPAAFEPSPSHREAPVLQEKPILSEMGRENTDGLLRAQELQAEYIKTDMMRAEKLKADRIKADRVKAKDVIVTSKSSSSSSRRRRPRISEFVVPDPIYEQTGIQRFNSVVGSPVEDTATKAYFYPYDTATDVPRYESVPTNTQFIRPRGPIQDPLPRQQDLFTRRRNPESVQGSVQQSRDRLPEFSSSKVLDQFSSTRTVPLLSEFIAEPASFISKRRRHPTLREELSASRQFYSSPTVPPFENQDYQFGSQDKTSKTYTSKTDPWYFK